MLAHLLVPLKFKLAAAGLVAVVGGGGAIALASTIASPSHPSAPVLHAAAAGQAQTVGPVSSASPAGQPAAAAPAAAPSAPGVAATQPTSGATTAPARTSTATKSVPSAAGGTASGTAVKIPAVPAAAAAVTCPADQKMTDAEINWLLKEVSKTAAQQPSLSGGAATINASLRPLLGQNLCASQAQPTVSALCADPAASQTIHSMIGQLPFYVKPLVGNPCTANLSTLLPKLSPFASSL